MTGPTEVARVGAVFRPERRPEDLQGFAELSEAVGLDDIWLWEDCFREGGLTSAAAALAWTSSLRVGLGLMPAPLRSPALAAMEIATLARLFTGRFVPACGHGVLSWMDQVGALAASPLTLLREWAGAVRELLHGRNVTVSGSYVRLDQVALDWPPAEAPPLLIGARGPKTLALAGEVADGLVLDAGISPDGVRAAVTAAAAQRPHEVVVYLLCGAGQDGLARATAELASSPWRQQGSVAGGSPADVARLIRGYSQAGATTVVLQPAGDDPDVAAMLRLAGAARALLREGAASA
jgi:alkanesulfonate monooxygenase SsuD/methylene tetrahydromethanopterin reductase-like flavin-dependent oxidoreductase (luciferase family)